MTGGIGRLGAVAVGWAGFALAGFGAMRDLPHRAAAGPDGQVLHGRYLVLSHLCGACHGGDDDPQAPGWLAGGDSFFIGGAGACLRRRVPQGFAKAGPKVPCYITRPRNLTPDDNTGLGRFSERQIFNALRFGLRPEDTPDVTITSNIPGKGNFPLHPHYLAPPMPWWSFRHMRDADLRAIAAYLKRGLRPVHHRVPESEGPPDFWAATYTGASPRLRLGPYPAPPFPSANEVGARAAAAPANR